MYKLPSKLYPENKDIKRVDALIGKADPIASAKRMASAIKNAVKAQRRAIAAKDMDRDDIAKIFFDRSAELSVTVGEGLATPGSLLPIDEQYKSNRTSPRGGSWVIPCGTLNLKTGNNKHFNVKTNGDSCIEVYRCADTGKTKFVITSGTTPIYQIGSVNFFCSYYRPSQGLFCGTMIDYIEAKDMEALISLYGNCPCYVYK